MTVDPTTPVPSPGPMDLGRIVDAVLGLYRQRPGLLLGICVVLQVPAGILAGVILLPIPGRLRAILGFDPFDPAMAEPGRLPDPADLPVPTDEQMLGLLLPLLAAMSITIVASTLTTGAIAHAAAWLRAGQPVTLSSAIAAVLGRLMAILGALAASSLAISGLALLAVVAFGSIIGLAPDQMRGGPMAFAALLALAGLLVLVVVVAIRWAFWPQAIVLDRAGPMGGLGWSWRTVAGSTWRVLGYALLFGLAAAVLSGLLAQLGLSVIGLIADVLPAPIPIVLGVTVRTVASLLLAPIVPLAMTLLYLDLRARRGQGPV